MIKKLFKKKTEKEKEISKLKSQLFRYRKKQEFFSPRIKTGFFKSDQVETISENRVKIIEEYEEKIQVIKQQLEELEES